MEDQFHSKYISNKKPCFYYSFTTVSHSPIKSFTYSKNNNNQKQFVLDCTNKIKSKMQLYTTTNDKFLQNSIKHFKNSNSAKNKLMQYDKENRYRRKVARLATAEFKTLKAIADSHQQRNPFGNKRDLSKINKKPCKQLQKQEFDEFIKKKKQMIQKLLYGKQNKYSYDRTQHSLGKGILKCQSIGLSNSSLKRSNANHLSFKFNYQEQDMQNFQRKNKNSKLQDKDEILSSTKMKELN